MTTSAPRSRGSLEATFERLRCAGRPGLIAYLTAGDPDMARSAELIGALAEHADVIELGLPCADPFIDGPVIRDSHRRALDAGATTASVLSLLERLKARSPTPVVMMTYREGVAGQDLEDFLDEALTAGADAILIPDGPDPARLQELPERHRHALIPMVSPHTPDAALAPLRALAPAFVYLASGPGPTGGAPPAAAVMRAAAARVRALTERPLAIGMGIRTPEDAACMATIADAVVVGTALVESIAAGAGGGAPAALRRVLSGLRRRLAQGPA